MMKVILLTALVCYCFFISVLFVNHEFFKSSYGSSSQCSDGFVPFEKAQSCYKVFNQEVVFGAAFDACFDQESLPVSISSQEENEFIAGLLKKTSALQNVTVHSNEVWIGLIYYKTNWRWIYPTPVKYLNWADGMPVKEGRYMGVVMDEAVGNKWKNVQAAEKRRVVCKKPIKV